VSPPYTGDLRWYQIGKDILTYVDANTTSRFGRVSVVAGLIAWDGCDCGALYLYANQTYESDDWPNQKVSHDVSDGCGAIYEGTEYVMQVLECAPTPQGQDNAPTVQAEDTAAQLIRQDAYQVRRAVKRWLCAAREDGDIQEYIVDVQIIQGPEGGCVGTEIRFRVGLNQE
jgi:hypothetical protein